MELIRVKDYEEMSDKAAEIMAEKLNSLDAPVLGLATGSTPEGLYERLINMNKQNKVSFQNVTTFNLDEYVGLAKDDPNSYHYYMREMLFKHIDIPEANTHLPNGDSDDLEQECRDYEQLIKDVGPIDVQLLGIGENGHIGFNEPGTSFASRTDIVDLVESTIQANARFFESMDDVPTRSITMGIETIMEAKEIILLASGAKKADAIAHMINGDVTERLPASVLQKHDRVTVIADEAALANI